MEHSVRSAMDGKQQHTDLNAAAAEQKQAKIFIKNNNNMYKNTWIASQMDGQRDGWMNAYV